MPPLTDEERKKLEAKVGELQRYFVAHLNFPYRQSEELKKTSAYRKSQGVCFAMSLDWLRRHLWNLYNPGAKAKRNLNDAKYNASEQARAKLTTKHGQLQDAYKGYAAKHVAPSVNSILTKMVEASVVSSGLDCLKSTNLDRLYSYDLDEKLWEQTARSAVRTGAPNAHYKFKQCLRNVLTTARQKLTVTAPAVGMLIELSGEESGHAIALLLQGARETFFDPNLGEYSFAPAELDLELRFVCDVWFDIYHRYFSMDGVTFNLVEWQVPPPPAV